jgi:membrane-bound lytic murein transglycosylase A
MKSLPHFFCLLISLFFLIVSNPRLLLADRPSLTPVSFSSLSFSSLTNSASFENDIWNHRSELILGIEDNILFLDSDNGDRAYQKVLDPNIDRAWVRRSLLHLRRLLQTTRTSEALRDKLSREFQLYRSIGNDGEGTVKFTGYFQPIFEARRSPTEEFHYPVYRAPENFESWPTPHPTRVRLEGYNGKGYQSSPIRGHEIAWLKNRYDAFMIHVQGSALLEYQDGTKEAIGFSHGTAYPFRGISQSFLDQHQIPWPDLANFFSHNPDSLNQLLARNNRFIFFKTLSSPDPLGSIGVPVIPERSIATDKVQLPPGAIGLIRTKMPVSSSTGQIELIQSSRLVLDQDTGSAIRGPGRVDLFMGTGEEARKKANMMYSTGELFYLLSKA